MNEELKILIQAELDRIKSESNINTSLQHLKIKPVDLKINFNEKLIKEQINNLTSSIKKQLSGVSVNIDMKSGTSKAINDIKSMTSELNKAKKIAQDTGKAIRDTGWIEEGVTASRGRKIHHDVRNYARQNKVVFKEDPRLQSEMRSILNMTSTPNSLSRAESYYARTKLSELRSEAKSTQEQFKEANRSFDRLALSIKRGATDASKDTRRLIDDYRRLDDKTKSILKNINKIKNDPAERQKAFDRGDLTRYQHRLQKISQQTKKQYNDQVLMQNKQSQQLLLNRLSVFKDANPKAVKDVQLSQQINKLSQGLNVDPKKLNANMIRNLSKEMSLLQSETHKMGMTGNTVFGTLGEKVKKFTAWFTISQTIMYGIRTMKQMYQEVVKIDTAMTNLRKVTEETEGTYRHFMTNAATMAKDLRANISEVIESTADWARLGYSMQEAQANAKASIVLKNVGEMDITSSTQAIISALKSYGSEVGNTMGIIDKYNEVGNNFAISSKGIAEAMQRSASALKLGGNSLDEAIAIITAGNAVIQNPDMVGTFAKTMTMRLRGAANIPKSLRDEVESMGEDLDGIDETVTQVQAKMLKFTQGRVQIMKDENTFKSTYEILKDINKVWDELADKDRASIVELVGGKTNYNSFDYIALSVQKCA